MCLEWRCLPMTQWPWTDPEHITSPPVHSVAFGDPRSSTQRYPPASWSTANLFGWCQYPSKPGSYHKILEATIVCLLSKLHVCAYMHIYYVCVYICIYILCKYVCIYIYLYMSVSCCVAIYSKLATELSHIYTTVYIYIYIWYNGTPCVQV